MILKHSSKYSVIESLIRLRLRPAASSYRSVVIVLTANANNNASKEENIDTPAEEAATPVRMQEQESSVNDAAEAVVELWKALMYKFMSF